MFFLFIHKPLRLNNLKTKTAMNAKISGFVICAEAIIYLLLRNLHDCTFKQNSRFTSRKRDLSLNHAMHHSHVITPIMLLLHESRLKKRANHTITWSITFTPSRQLFYCFTNHALKKWSITPSRQLLGAPLLWKRRNKQVFIYLNFKFSWVILSYTLRNFCALLKNISIAIKA